MGNSFILIVVGLLVFYLVISDKWNCFEGFLACVIDKTNKSMGAPIVPSIPNSATVPNISSPTTISNNPFDQNIFYYGF